MKTILYAILMATLLSVACFAQGSWNNQSSGITSKFQDVLFADQEYGWAYGTGAKITHTADGDKTGQCNLPQPVTIFLEYHFSDINNRWVVGADGSGDRDQWPDI